MLISSFECCKIRSSTFQNLIENFGYRSETQALQKTLHLAKSVKFVGVRIHENLHWKDHVNKIPSKLIRGEVTITKIKVLC